MEVQTDTNFEKEGDTEMKGKPLKSESLPVRTDEATRADLESLAEMARRTLPDYLRIVLEDHIQANNQKLEEYRGRG